MRYDNKAIAVKQKGNGNLCGLDNIPEDITMAVMVDAEGLSTKGIVKVSFSLPKTACNYKVALVVNSSINSQDECKKHEFNAHGLNAEEIHTVDKSYCIINNKFDNSYDSQELEVPFCQDAKNPDQKLSIWYESVYSGCYALRFKIDDLKVVYKGHLFMTTDHQRAQINVPQFRCKYTSLPEENSSFDTLMFTTSTSNVVQFKGLHQQITVLSDSDEDKENACVKYNKNSIFTHKIYTDRANATADNCTISVAGNSNGVNVECNFEVRTFKNAGYCVVINVLDERCKKKTGWNAPIHTAPLPCVWVQNCISVTTNHSDVVYGGNLPQHENIITSEFLCLPLVTITLLVFLATVGSIFCICRLRSRNSKCNSSTCSIDLKEEVDSKCLEVEEFKYQDDLKKEKANVKDIVLLYTKESKTFMKTMSDFRNALERCVKCHVYDWHAPEEWDNVATVGGYEWVAKLLRKDCRVVWIDTAKARSLFASQYILINTKFARNAKAEKFADFRDSVFPAVVDLAKRSLQHMMMQYSKHYVVRIEGFGNLDETSDPFADISPHVRYIIPHHLRELCFHLSMQLLSPEEEIQSEETRLRQNLIINEGNQDDLSLYKIY
ncbi:uncharacterized protein LOC117170327 isoform X2 [Belonocnema kinseyi]|nr:uncharacterized protein LOC117170327 isoform X2 [Belonocnema kinseyi]